MTETPLRVGGRYDLGEVLGRGGMADVRRARDSVLGREVAIKLLRTTDELDRSRFDSEARLLALLSHENVVTVLDAGVDDGVAWLALELIDGDTLADRYRRGPLDPAALAGIGAQVAAALHHAHQRGVVHRDVKPSNVLVDGTHRARLTDFGIARLVEDRSALTLTGHAVGTAAYIAPEQVSGEPVTTASDVYALGLLLLEGLTGRREYPGPPIEAALARLQRSPLVPVSLPTGWPSLIATMTARRPEERPTAEAVAQRLRVLARVRSAEPAASATALIPTPPPSPQSDTGPGPGSVPVAGPVPLPVGSERGARRRAGWVLAGVAAAVALVVAASALVLGGAPGDSPVDSVVDTSQPATSGPAPVTRTTPPTTDAPATSSPVPVVADPGATTPADRTGPTPSTRSTAPVTPGRSTKPGKATKPTTQADQAGQARDAGEARQVHVQEPGPSERRQAEGQGPALTTAS